MALCHGVGARHFLRESRGDIGNTAIPPFQRIHAQKHGGFFHRPRTVITVFRSPVYFCTCCACSALVVYRHAKSQRWGGVERRRGSSRASV